MRSANVKVAPFLLAVAALFLSPSLCIAQTAFQSAGGTVTLSVTGTTSRVQVRTGPTSANIRVYNSGTVAVFLVCGDVAAVATTATGLPIAPGSVEVLGCNQQYIAGISAGTAATVYLTAGSGI